MPGYHAKISPSHSKTWALCPASRAREALEPPETGPNDAADWGTVAHDLSEHVLIEGDSYLEDRFGHRAAVDEQGDVLYGAESLFPDGHLVDEEMAACVMTYVDFVRDLVNAGGELHVEVRVPIEHITHEEGATGTSDAVVVYPTELVVADLKGGIGVQVFAKEVIDGQHENADAYRPDFQREFDKGVLVVPNSQLVMYADGALEKFNVFETIETVRIIIVQPRLGHIDEYVMTVEELKRWVHWLKIRVALGNDVMARAIPGVSQCQWCRASGNCPEQRTLAEQQAIDDFATLDENDKFTPGPRNVPDEELGRAYRLIPIIEQYIKAVEKRVFAKLSNNEPVAGYKLVTGGQGHRAFTNETAVAGILTKAGYKAEEIHETSLLSPAQIEKKLGKKKKDVWEQCQAYVSRPEGKPTVVAESDPRPSVHESALDDFSTGDDFAAFF